MVNFWEYLILANSIFITLLYVLRDTTVYFYFYEVKYCFIVNIDLKLKNNWICKQMVSGAVAHNEWAAGPRSEWAAGHSQKGTWLVSQRSWVRYPVWPHTFISPSGDSSYWRKYDHKVTA